jgi:predicted Zn-dependent protease
LSLSLFSLSRSRGARAAVLAAALCQAAWPLAAQAQNNLPSLGDTASDDFGITPERKLGEQIMREIRRDPDYLDDPLLLGYLQSVWQPLVNASRAQGQLGPDVDERFPFEVFLVRDRSVNAFALPGGYVGVHSGLIGMTASRDELAAVLAHELTHVTQRHIARGFANSKRQSLIGLASMIIGVLAASRSGVSTDAANAVLVGGQAAAVQGQLNFSRDMEREADRIGYSVLTGAGFAALGMASMFEKLALSSRLNDNGAFPYLRSHPLTSERLGEARARLGPGTAASGAPGAVAAPRTFDHSVVQAYARVLGDTRVDSLRRWQALDANGCPGAAAGGAASADAVHDALLACVQSAVASQLLRDWPRSDAAFAQAAKLLTAGGSPAGATAAQRWLDLMQAQSFLQRGDASRAGLLLQQQQRHSTGGDGNNNNNGGSQPMERAVLVLGAQVAAAQQPPQTAAASTQADALQRWLAGHPGDSQAWAALSRLWAALGQRLRSVRAEAESRYALGDLTGALDRLRSGQALVRTGQAQDFIEASVIDARVRNLEAEQKRLLLEQRAQ